MSDAVVTGLFTLGGTALGFVLGGVYHWWQDRQTTKSVCTLIRLELESQQHLLREWWEDVKKLNSPIAYSGRDEFTVIFTHLLSRPLPEWSHTHWDGLSALIERSLDERSIQRADSVHNALRQLTLRYDQLTHLEPPDYNDWQAVKEEKRSSFEWATRMTAGRGEEWEAFRYLVNHVLDTPATIGPESRLNAIEQPEQVRNGHKLAMTTRDDEAQLNKM